MTDYEAVYESVMKYVRVDFSRADSQQKLRDFLREGDRRNVMSDKLLDRLVETRAAERDLEAAKSSGGDAVSARRRAAASENDARYAREVRVARENGFLLKGSVTTREGVRHAVFVDTRGRPIYYDEKTRRAREVVSTKDGFKITGRFAKTPRMFPLRS